MGSNRVGPDSLLTAAITEFVSCVRRVNRERAEEAHREMIRNEDGHDPFSTDEILDAVNFPAELCSIAEALAEQLRAAKFVPLAERFLAFAIRVAPFSGFNYDFDQDVPLLLASLVPIAGLASVRIDIMTATTEDTSPSHTSGSGKPTHDDDFRNVTVPEWSDGTFTFTEMEAKVVKRLWAAWKNREPEVTDRELCSVAGSRRSLLAKIFIKHKKGEPPVKNPAWGRLIIPGPSAHKTLGTRRLNLPPAHPA